MIITEIIKEVPETMRIIFREAKTQEEMKEQIELRWFMFGNAVFISLALTIAFDIFHLATLPGWLSQ